MIVSKAVSMAEMMNVPILGIIENMSHVVCPDCGKKIQVFGDSHIESIALTHGIRVLARLPMDPALAAATDAGNVGEYSAPDLVPALDAVSNL